MPNRKIDYAKFEQVYTPEKTGKISKIRKMHLMTLPIREEVNGIYNQVNTKFGGNMNIRNENKSYIVREGLTMSEVIDRLVEEHGWSSSVLRRAGKLQRGNLR